MRYSDYPVLQGRSRADWQGVNNALTDAYNMRRQREQDAQDQQMNALRMQFEQARLDDLMRQEQERAQYGEVIKGLARPQQVPGTGPMRGDNYQPLDFSPPLIPQGTLANALAQRGLPQALDFIPKEAAGPTLKEFGGRLGYVSPQGWQDVQGAPVVQEDPYSNISADLRAQILASQDPRIAEALKAQEAAALRKAQAGATRVDVGLGQKDTLKFAGDLRGEYTQLTKDFRTIRDSYSRVKAAAQDPSAAGDLSLIFAYMKMLDPNSTVREGEFANAQNAAGVPDQIMNLYNRAASGERLNPRQRADFLNQANKQYQQSESQRKKTEASYRALAKRAGVDPDLVIFGMGEEDAAVQPGLPAVELNGKQYRKNADGTWEEL